MAKRPTRLEALADDLRKDRTSVFHMWKLHGPAPIGVGLVAIARAITEVAIEVVKRIGEEEE